MEKQNVDFNSQEFNKKIQKDSSIKNNKFTSNKKESKFNTDSIENAKSLLKGKLMPLLIFLLIYFVLTGIVGNFIFLFSNPLYFLIGFVSIFILYKVLKKFIFKKIVSKAMSKIKF